MLVKNNKQHMILYAGDVGGKLDPKSLLNINETNKE
jgi:hypothetical protein